MQACLCLGSAIDHRGPIAPAVKLPLPAASADLDEPPCDVRLSPRSSCDSPRSPPHEIAAINKISRPAPVARRAKLPLPAASAGLDEPPWDAWLSPRSPRASPRSLPRPIAVTNNLSRPVPITPTGKLPLPAAKAGIDEPPWDAWLSPRSLPNSPSAKLKASGKTKLCVGCLGVLSLSIVTTINVVGIILMPIDLQTNFQAFQKADVLAYITRSGFMAARTERESSSENRRLDVPEQLTGRYFDFEIAYATKGTHTNLMSLDVLTKIRDMEVELRALPSWNRMCEDHTEASKKSLCNPGASLANYLSPKLDFQRVDGGGPVDLVIDGGIRDPLPLEAVMHMVPDDVKQHIMVNSSRAFGDTLTKLRTVYRFFFICCSIETPARERSAWLKRTKEEWKKLLREEVLPFMHNQVNRFDLEITYDGSDVYSVEVLQLIDSDLGMAYISIAVVLAYIAFHTRSIMLSIVAIVTVVSAVPLSYVVFAAMADTTEMNIASLLSLFLVVGLGSDVVFVYTDFWRESKYKFTSAPQRMRYTLRNAGKATFATSAATALSFFANLASVLRPLREFGLFMGMCVMLVWFLVPLIYLPACMFDELWLRCCRFDSCRQKTSEDAASRHRALRGFVKSLYICRYCYVIIPAVTLSIMFVVAVTQIETSSKQPQLLPETHPLNNKGALESFANVRAAGSPSIETQVPMCNPSKFKEICGSLAWCIASEMPRNSTRECRCYRSTKKGNCERQNISNVTHRVIGRDALSESELWTLADAMPGDKTRFPTRNILESMVEKQAPPILFHDWLTGAIEFRAATQVSSTLMKAPADYRCGFNYLCFCDDLVCPPDDSWEVSESIFLGERRLRKAGTNDTELGSVARRQAPARRMSDLLQTTLASRKTSVQVVHGLILQGGSPIVGQRDASDSWSFNEDFEFKDPWAQRGMLKFCNLGQLQDWGLHVQDTTCWIDAFKIFMINYSPRSDEPSLPVDQELRFPVHASKFHYFISEFARSTKISSIGQNGVNHRIERYLWIRHGELKAAYMSFLTSVDYATSGASAAGFKKKWDMYLNKFASGAFDGAPSAYHTSELWVSLEVQDALIRSVIMTLVILVGLAFLTVLLFTESLILSLIVVVMTSGVLCGLLFIIVVAMDDDIGPIEVIALIVFIGYSVTYSLHIVHHYGEPAAVISLESEAQVADVRLSRVTYAIASIGGGISGSAATTCACSAFLLGCTLSIFRKLGMVAIAVTLMSTVLSLFSLPALLLIMGPKTPGALRHGRLRNFDIHTSTTVAHDPSGKDAG